MTAALKAALRDARDARDRAHDAFSQAVISAHDAGYGYGTIARALGLPRSTVQGMIQRYRKGT